ncbi:YSIRK-targeted triacylglycerol lipase [Staphylococcus arlettae]|uniref:triacylglycerol lipase n=1 Tax=Staphylococcus arlettae TaxID=29378 RepID=A0A380BXI4_9STAP|nr:MULTISPECIES: YSIRK-type signal peptide-containing protein [Staphylococcus]MCD8849556.1 YSIRK-type signal peptide-containing protein [Staphylococcus arlettae]MEB5899501.1 YSIRK-type signal peptide-containing protein [Staphylococcus arlettae]PNZ54534.1 lipase [Staphylococcus arlettae]SUJ07740.1 lipase [Staphylococcus arlettae]GEQ00425.1 lipase [Staphylococcus arlettae]
MNTEKQKYSIRKLSIGAASALIGVLLFISNDTAHASEQQNNTTTETAMEQHSTTEQDFEKPKTSVKQDTTNTVGQNTEERTEFSTEENQQSTKENNKNEQYEGPKTSENAQVTTTKETVDNKQQTITDEKSDSEQFKEPSAVDNSQQAVTTTDTTQYNQDEPTDSKDTKSTTEAQHKKAKSTIEHPEPKETTVLQPTDNQQHKRQQNQQSSNIAPDDANKGVSTVEQPRETQRQTISNDLQMYETNNQQRNNAQTSVKITPNKKTTNTYADTTLQQQKNIDRDSLATTNTRPVSLEEVGEPLLVHGSSRNSTPEEQKSLAALEGNTQATRTNNTTQEATPITDDQPTKVAKQGQFKNEDPIILVHGFNGFTGDNKPTTEGNYWGGDKLSISQDLRDNGYETYEASVGALSSNYDRAVELYYYIKGGTVDYGAAHANKYGHERYGRTYEGVYKDWQPGQQVHLVGHSMGGQTIRLLDTMLREGNQEEIAYHQQHGGEISPLYQGGNDDMITSVTTIVTPHNGTHAADQLGNEQLIRQVAYDYSKFQNNKLTQVDYGFSQWGLKQRPNETYIDYVKRVKDQSNIWLTDDNGFYDLTRKGAAELNEQTSLDPNVVYKTYTGESTRASITGRQVSDINMKLSFRLTGNVIGKAAETEWRENDGLVSVVSAQHPFNQDFVTATDDVQKGVWQVTPVKHDWDHEDFIGSDVTQSVVTTEALQQFWHGIAADLVRNEDIAAQA